MYDPLIVDTFLRVHYQLAPEPVSRGSHGHALTTITTSGLSHLRGSSQFDEIASSAGEMFSLYDLASGLGGKTSFRDVIEVVANHLRRLLPSTLCVFYVYDAVKDILRAEYVIGESAPYVRGLEIPLGQRLSGWVAANRQTIINSDPVLDLGDVARRRSSELRASISTPIVADEQLVGVLSLYSSDCAAFNDEHRRIIEIVAAQVAEPLKTLSPSDVIRQPERLCDLRDSRASEQVVVETELLDRLLGCQFSLVLIDIGNLNGASAEFEPTQADRVLRDLTGEVLTALGSSIILLRNGASQLVVLVTAGDQTTARSAAARIVNQIRAVAQRGVSGLSCKLRVSFRCASAPVDGTSLRELLENAVDAGTEVLSMASTMTIH